MITAQPRQGQASDAAGLLDYVRHRTLLSYDYGDVAAIERDLELMLRCGDLADEDVDTDAPEVNANSREYSDAWIAALSNRLAELRRRGATPRPTRLGFDRELLDRIRAGVAIEDAIGAAVPLTRRGSHYVGTCPFHNDKSPSLVVWPEIGGWRCFGCQASGDLFTWFRDYWSMPFPEVVALCAERAGIELPRTVRSTVRIDWGRSA